MAWISVHEQVLGGKLRRLAKDINCSQNEALGLLVRLWLWGIHNADKDGMIIGATKEDVADVLNIGIDSKYSSEKAVDSLIETEWIDIDDNSLFIHDWNEWQEQWYKAIETRQKDAERKRIERERKRAERNQALKNNKTTSEVIKKGMEELLKQPDLTIPHEEVSKKHPTIEYAKDFEDFWSVYPKKVGKGEAYKKYKARINDGWSPQELKVAAQNYAAKVQKERTDKQYIKHPKTFLSEATPFTDYLKQKISDKLVNYDDPYADWRK